MDIIHPKAFPFPGGHIAIFSPSTPAVHAYPHRVERACKALEEAMNCTVEVPLPARARTGYKALHPHLAAEEFHRLAEDPKVDSVMMALGGFNSNSILPYLDFDFLRANPKIYCGYSDASALLMAIFAKSRLVTFHGPALLPQWGELGGPFPEMIAAFARIICSHNPPLDISPMPRWTSERVDWSETSASPLRIPQPSEGWKVWRRGSAIGRLIGGNLGTINSLIGTPWSPTIDEPILFFIEATEAEAYLPRLERYLTHLCHAGWFDNVVGLLVGRIPDAQEVEGVTLKDMVLSVLDDTDIPIIADIDLGHTDPLITLPVGGLFEILADESSCRITLLEKVVE